jgi:hypothetical protein
MNENTRIGQQRWCVYLSQSLCPLALLFDHLLILPGWNWKASTASLSVQRGAMAVCRLRVVRVYCIPFSFLRCLQLVSLSGTGSELGTCNFRKKLERSEWGCTCWRSWSLIGVERETTQCKTREESKNKWGDIWMCRYSSSLSLFYRKPPPKPHILLLF